MNKVFSLGLGLLTFLFTSCDPDMYYSEFMSLPEEGWSKEKTAVFQVSMKDTLSSFDIRMHVRNGTDYPYQNLFLFIRTTSPSGASITDTVEYFLANPSGKWLGKGVGDIHESDFPFKKGVRFPEYGSYTFEVQQGMRTDKLRGLYDIGLSVQAFDP